MTEESDEKLEQIFRDTYSELLEENFTSRVMKQISRYEKYLLIYRYLGYFALLVAVWFLAPYIQSASLVIAALPGQGLLSSMVNDQLNPVLLPLLFILVAACVSYILINIISNR